MNGKPWPTHCGDKNRTRAGPSALGEEEDELEVTVLGLLFIISVAGVGFLAWIVA